MKGDYFFVFSGKFCDEGKYSRDPVFISMKTKSCKNYRLGLKDGFALFVQIPDEYCFMPAAAACWFFDTN